MWAEEIQRYALQDDYFIQRADPEEWGMYCTIYYNMAYNGFFREETYVTSSSPAYWIYQGEIRVGGVRMSPNQIYYLFFIPPFHDEALVMRGLKRLLLSWSDRREAIKTFEVLPDQVDLYARAGFWPDPFRCRWMQRPTEHFDVVWGDAYRIETLQREAQSDGSYRYVKEQEITDCHYASFIGGLDATRRGQLAKEDHIPSIDPNYTNDVLMHASTLVYDQETNELVANCRVGLQGDYAAVYSIGVLPAYRGRGLASMMLRRALSELKGSYSLLRLYVMQGNDAESVYLKLGFVPGPLEVQKMEIPPLTD
ncbi:GNAT family N-acetyltransferase [Paenibacillus guangzhouensis]|uniref:GNAT family N-acetyltransferase n=1 Tax=Paenibacillus guangzhouensis TaxID=1473112 RepID=UPI001266C66B|nr:GNAT family N-acetyltransferase [Paenibacillus guangzhouensis]